MKPAAHKGEAWAIELERGTGRLLPVRGLVAFDYSRDEARSRRRALTGWPKARVVKVAVSVKVIG